MNNRDMIREIKTSTIVTAQRGSWRWQDAYKVAEYRARENDGYLVWYPVRHSGKMSMPQLRAAGLAHLRRGSKIGRTVTREEAAWCIGWSGVAQLERSGWKFDENTADA